MQCGCQFDPGRESRHERKEIETDKEMNQLLEDHGHRDLTPNKALGKWKAEIESESNRQKFDTSLQYDLAKRHKEKKIWSSFGDKGRGITQKQGSPSKIQKRLTTLSIQLAIQNF